MSEINVYFITDEARATIEANLEKFTQIVKDNPYDSDAFIAELPKDCFIEKKYLIEDFELKTSDDGYSKVDLNNSLVLYKHLKNLPKYVLADERFWLWIILKKAYAATVQAMPIDSEKNKNVIKDHWLFGQGGRRSLMFNTLSRAFYRVYLTKDDTLNNPFELTEFATENYIRYRELTWRTYSNNKNIVIGVLKAEKKLLEDYGEEIESIKGYYPEIAKHVSKLGSVMLLDSMLEEFIRESVIDFGENLAKKNELVKKQQDMLVNAN